MPHGAIFSKRGQVREGAGLSVRQALESLRERLAKPTKLPIFVGLSIDLEEGTLPDSTAVERVVRESEDQLKFANFDRVVVQGVSCATELWLDTMLAQGLQYRLGGPSFHVAPAFSAVISADERVKAESAMSALKGTGVCRGLSRLLRLACDTQLVNLLPVSDMDSMVSLGYEDGSQLVDLISLKMPATVDMLVGKLRDSGRISGDLLNAKLAKLDCSGGNILLSSSFPRDQSIDCGSYVVELKFNRKPKVMKAKADVTIKCLPAVAFGDLRSKNRKG